MHTNINTTDPTLVSMSFEHNETHAQLEILQSAFKAVLSSTDMQEADLPMLDVLYALNEHFSDLLKRS